MKTTGIFVALLVNQGYQKRKHWLFENTKQALAANFRPCKRCKPTGQRMPDEEWIAFVTEYVDSHYEEKLTLEVLALLSHGTPYHLHRTFKNQGHDPSGLHPTCSNREGENVIDYFG